LADFQSAQKDAKDPWYPSLAHPPRVQAQDEGNLLCTEAQKDALVVRLLFFLARSISSDCPKDCSWSPNREKKV
jgi:hypothetical protein